MDQATINRYILSTETREGRSLLWHICNDFCGVDLTEGATIAKQTCEFDLGRKSVGMKIFNDLMNSKPEIIAIMKTEKEYYNEY